VRRTFFILFLGGGLPLLKDSYLFRVVFGMCFCHVLYHHLPVRNSIFSCLPLKDSLNLEKLSTPHCFKSNFIFLFTLPLYR
jgi:hypothetical protein